MVESWFSDPSRVGATILLMTAVVALARGWVVPRWTHDAALTQAQRELDRAVSDCQTHRDMNIRLLGQMERAVSVAEVTADTAAKVARKS